MSVNSSSLSNTSLDSALLNSTIFTASVIGAAFYITRMCLLFPLSILILNMGHRRWWQQRSFQTMSNSDMFTYQIAVLELIWGLGTVVSLCGFYCNVPDMINAGAWLCSFVLCGETFFHLLTCVERYLAVVHPITYHGLRSARRVRIRNISIGCTWMLSLVWSSTVAGKSFNLHVGPFFFLLVFSLTVVFFCSLSVLCVLIRPKPGEQGRDREIVDKSKQRIFLTIVSITGLLLFWFVGVIVCFALSLSPLLSDSVRDVLKNLALWFSLPSSFVLPLLYLHREGKRLCCSYSGG